VTALRLSATPGIRIGRRVVCRRPSAPQHLRTAGREHAALERCHFRRRHLLELPRSNALAVWYVRVIDADHFRRLIEPRGADRDEAPLPDVVDRSSRSNVQRASIPSVQNIDAQDCRHPRSGGCA
jgi:hypothetical protein